MTDGSGLALALRTVRLCCVTYSNSNFSEQINQPTSLLWPPFSTDPTNQMDSIRSL